MAEPSNEKMAQLEHHQAIGVIDPCLDDKQRFVREITEVFYGVQSGASPQKTAVMSITRATLLVDAWKMTCQMADGRLLRYLFREAMMRNDGGAGFYVFGYLKSKHTAEELPTIFDELLDHRGVLHAVHCVGDVEFTKVALKCKWPMDQFVYFVHALFKGFYAIPQLSEDRLQQLRNKPSYEVLGDHANDVRIAKASGRHEVSHYTTAIFTFMESSELFLNELFQAFLEFGMGELSLGVHSISAHALHGMDVQALRSVIRNNTWNNFELAQTMQTAHFLGCACQIDGYTELSHELFYMLVKNLSRFPTESITRRPCLAVRSVHCHRRLNPKFKDLHIFVGLGHQSVVFGRPFYKYAKQDFDMTVHAVTKLSPPVGDLVALLEEATSMRSDDYVELAVDALQTKILPSWWSGEKLVGQRNFLSVSMTDATFEPLWQTKVLQLGWHENAFAEALAMAVASHALEPSRALLQRIHGALPKEVPKYIKSDFELDEGSSSGSKRAHDEMASDNPLFLSHVIIHMPGLLADLLVHQPTRDSLTKEVVGRAISEVLNHCAESRTNESLESYRSYLEDLLLLPFEITVDDVEPSSEAQPLFESLLEKLFEPPSDDNPRGGRRFAPLETSFSTNAVVMDAL